jgi:succinate dehydrogenase/fumarate reductase-like Fe-S protein
MRISIRRGSANGAHHLLDYSLPDSVPDGLHARAWSDLSISNVLAWLQAEREPDLGYELACRRGLCNVCMVRANGAPVQACITPFRDEMVIEPVRDHLQLHDTIAETSLIRRHRAIGIAATMK